MRRLQVTDVELAPDRDMVGRLGLAALVLVDADGREAVGGLRREQQMVDAQAVVLLPGAGLVIPVGVLRPLDMDGAHRVGQAEIEQRAQRARATPAG